MPPEFDAPTASTASATPATPTPASSPASPAPSPSPAADPAPAAAPTPFSKKEGLSLGQKLDAKAAMRAKRKPSTTPRGPAPGDDVDPDVAAAAISKPPGQPHPAGIVPANPATAAAAAPAFAPNFKFKAYQQEHEIPELFRGLIKDPESQQAVQKVFERAFGFDHLKGMHEQMKGNLTDLNQKHQTLLGRIAPINEAVQKQDVAFLVQEGYLTEQALLQWAAKRAQYYQAPPEQRQIIDEREAALRNQRQSTHQFTEREESYLNELAQTRMMLLDVELTKPDVAPIVQLFEGTRGPGSFKEVLRQYAVGVHASTGRDLAPQELVREFLKQFGPLYSPQTPSIPGAAHNLPPMGQPPQSGSFPPGHIHPSHHTTAPSAYQAPTIGQAPTMPQAAPQYVPPAAPPAPPAAAAPPVQVIPNVQGRNASPTKPRVRNMGHIDARLAELNARG